MITFYFNNKHSIQEGFYLKEKPILPIAEEEVKNIGVISRTSGTLTQNTGNFKDITIDLKIRVVTNEYRMTYDNLLRWIKNVDNNELMFSSDVSKAYIVKYVTIKDIKVLEGCFDCSLIFHCEPFLSPSHNTKKEIEFDKPFEVRTHLSCPCIIELKGVIGSDDINLTINDTPFSIYKPIGDIIIDSNLMVCYKAETYTTIQTSSKFPLLKNGANIIKCDSKNIGNCFITVKPLWRY